MQQENSNKKSRKNSRIVKALSCCNASTEDTTERLKQEPGGKNTSKQSYLVNHPISENNKTSKERRKQASYKACQNASKVDNSKSYTDQR